ncbi:hypothetical protein RRX38_01185 [Pseudomonas sp. DTU_2021_1001937_2_SI_NGA_ILE_001]|uniref:hypothetical protein n=1 Tax=Pseudomonas sp. DTU_2021_1001937_2_SI_NGA_ILE_001 TaxID=3077589 RepID=UPI0028FC262D|nr:hypothetical protein [Pseudomonas sp. DTU_2021_1001937_2_SI_NGA_ILE_001]WNW09817.1 hypothetical protein RRX38_01185 [Pseudomonas sp. DTU_2021_1001937_2_SI_NGA_ILE_001]
MSLSKREQAHLERLLGRTLTEACETAKAQLPGFQWLTHEVDYQRFPASLLVTWVFDTEASRQAALLAGQDQRMNELTGMALAEAGIHLEQVERHVSCDSEQACQRSHAGDWQARLARRRGRH